MPVAPTTPNSPNSSFFVSSFWPFPLFLKFSLKSVILNLFPRSLFPGPLSNPPPPPTPNFPYILDSDTTDFPPAPTGQPTSLPTNIVFAFPSFILPTNDARLLPAGRLTRSCPFGFLERLVPYWSLRPFHPTPRFFPSDP